MLHTKQYCHHKILNDVIGKRVISSSVKFNHAALVTESGEVYTWGKGSHGNLGHGDLSNHSIPNIVQALSDKVCIQIDCGNNHSAVLTNDGKVFTFGSGEYGKLGHGDNKNADLPRLVQALETTDIAEVQCGLRYTVALSKSV